MTDAGDGDAQVIRFIEPLPDNAHALGVSIAIAIARAAIEQAKSEFLSRMSHELRTPLNAMLGFTQLLELDRRQPLAPHQLEWTGQVRQAGWHLLHMINDRLDLARIETGRIDLHPRALDLTKPVNVPQFLATLDDMLEQLDTQFG